MPFALLKSEGSHSPREMNRETGQPETRDAQDRLLSAVVPFHFRIKSEALMNQIAGTRGKDQEKQSSSGPCRKHERVDDNDAGKARHLTPMLRASLTRFR